MATGSLRAAILLAITAGSWINEVVVRRHLVDGMGLPSGFLTTAWAKVIFDS